MWGREEKRKGGRDGWREEREERWGGKIYENS